ncbi:hypothetical protein BS17DRAFT_790224 [Gyrodon lividus]|nr:hypothetical protein BS17DRAFT_790224 [Gyrodon lividus]
MQQGDLLAQSVQSEKWLTALREFVRAVWGNETIFKKQHYRLSGADSAERVVEYLDFGVYFWALRRLLPGSRLGDGKLLVRTEYNLAMEAFEEDYQTGAYIIGQPGIGKSYFLLYALIERLRKRQPVAFQFHPNTYAFFMETSVTLHSEGSTSPLDDSDLSIWALSDSNADITIPAYAFRTAGVRVFQATSPNARRWKEWTKQASVEPYVMDFWSVEETADLASLLNLDVERMTDFATAWGGVPRTLLTLFNSPSSDSDFESKINEAAYDAITSAPTFIRSLQRLDVEKSGPSSVIFVKPRQDSTGRIYRRQPAIYIPTPRIVDILATNIIQHDAAVKTSFFAILESHSTTRNSAGAMYERWFHSFFLSGQSIEYWCHDGNIPRTLQLATRLVCTNDELRGAAPPFYWLPSKTNFPGIDGAFFVGGNIFAIQVTLAYNHSTPQTSLDHLWTLLPPEKRALRWNVLFVGLSKGQVWNASKQWSGKLTIGTSTRKTTVPVGWCALDPTTRNITYIGSDGTRYDKLV